MPWPKEVDVLTARNIHKFEPKSADKARDAIGWIVHWFGLGSEHVRAIHVLWKISGKPYSIVEWNIHKKTKKSDIAKALNQMTAKLGYVVGNPEA